MLLEIFKFEINYRAKRADTYFYFAVVFLFSIISMDVLVDGQIGTGMWNSPYQIARIMAIISAFFTIITSMIMGVSALRDFDHNMESLMFINPIRKRDYLLGRFLGSFVVLLFIFSGLLFGMIIGDFLPWRNSEYLLPFNIMHFLQPFLWLIIPNLFFCGAVFFVSGALSRKLMVVYLQGVFLLVAYILSISLLQNAKYSFLAAILDPFSFQTSSVVTQFWTVAERNSLALPMGGLFLYNRLIWISIGCIAMAIGYIRFEFKLVRKKVSKNELDKVASDEQVSAQKGTPLIIDMKLK